MMLPFREIRDLADARSIADVGECLKSFARSRGFARYSAMKIYQPPGMEFHATDSVDNYLAAFLEGIYVDDEAAKIDPVMQHMKHRHTPVWWTRQTYEDAGCVTQWESAVRLDPEMRGGVSIALHLPGGWHFACGMETADIENIDALFAQRVVSDLTLLASHAADLVMSPRFDSVEKASPDVHLTARGLEVLRLVSGGKSNKEISNQLGITQRTVVKHLAECAERLRCPSGRREQVVAQALRLDLL